MSDPTARRADVLTSLLNAMRQSQGEEGWTLQEIRTFIFKRYRRGVRQETIDLAIKQLIDMGELKNKWKGKELRFWATSEAY